MAALHTKYSNVVSHYEKALRHHRRRHHQIVVITTSKPIIVIAIFITFSYSYPQCNQLPCTIHIFSEVCCHQIRYYTITCTIFTMCVTVCACVRLCVCYYCYVFLIRGQVYSTTTTVYTVHIRRFHVVLRYSLLLSVFCSFQPSSR